VQATVIIATMKTRGKRTALIVRHPNVLPSRRSTVASSASVLLDESFAGRRAYALPLQLSHRVREHLEDRKSLVSKPAVGERSRLRQPHSSEGWPRPNTRARRPSSPEQRKRHQLAKGSALDIPPTARP